MRNVNAILQEKARTSIFIAHRLRTVVEAGAFAHSMRQFPMLMFSRRFDHCAQGRHSS